ncbi:hypothetical protein FRACYDRAFT_246799 [Fragilariopsis cylindrus CCMP1102]|uniref:Uncharacterized protein n=1 Tax=Fragilariopsis cylindrus CCMP1102 TaxID=635003 RepID=A0A1E7EYK9_9STRA|nr:hypothetical protein FRACYDRAFT_246799 [Fragilariopsis cylindrus CCMP1102]|eukprot:OEU10924.1 hypothetical protein FRACYDRAFT_246799 [Fragilariopsis cylindrus CCMP1102]
MWAVGARVILRSSAWGAITFATDTRRKHFSNDIREAWMLQLLDSQTNIRLYCQEKCCKWNAMSKLASIDFLKALVLGLLEYFFGFDWCDSFRDTLVFAGLFARANAGMMVVLCKKSEGKTEITPIYLTDNLSITATEQENGSDRTAFIGGIGDHSLSHT